MKEVYQHPEFGEITVNRSPRAKNVSISVRQDGIRLTIPARVGFAKALELFDRKHPWVRAAIKRSAERKGMPKTVLPPFETRHHRLELLPRAVELPGWEIGPGLIRVKYPKERDPGEEAIQAVIREAILSAYRLEAKKLLPVRIRELAAKNGLVYRKLSLRDAVGRWGSCSAANAISLNIRLMMLPDRLVDYVILHELCHTVEKNHGPRFYELLDRVTGGKNEDLQKEMKMFTPRF